LDAALVLLQVTGQHLADRRLVLDDEHRRWGQCGSLPACARGQALGSVATPATFFKRGGLRGATASDRVGHAAPKASGPTRTRRGRKVRAGEPGRERPHTGWHTGTIPGTPAAPPGFGPASGSEDTDDAGRPSRTRSGPRSGGTDGPTHPRVSRTAYPDPDTEAPPSRGPPRPWYSRRPDAARQCLPEKG